jgi:hypothetical protein
VGHPGYSMGISPLPPTSPCSPAHSDPSRKAFFIAPHLGQVFLAQTLLLEEVVEPFIYGMERWIGRTKALFALPPDRPPPAATPRARRWQHSQRPLGRPQQRRAVRRSVVVQQPGPAAQERGEVRRRGFLVRGSRDDQLGKAWGGTMAHDMSRRTEVLDPVVARTSLTRPRVTPWV